MITANNLQLLKNSGFKVVGKYISENYRLTAAERDVIVGGRLSIVSIFEACLSTEASYFTAQHGTSDAMDAISEAQNLG